MDCAVLIVGAGLLQVPLIQEAKNLGLYVIATDRNLDAPGFAFTDEGIVIDTYDVEAHKIWAHTWADHTQPYPLCGVTTSGADVAVTVAEAAAAAHVPGIPVSVARNVGNKAAVRDTLLTTGLQCYQPEWMHWVPGDMPCSIAEAIENEIGYPCVLKPLHQRASRGVSIVRTADHLIKALEKVMEYGDSFLVEEYLTGTEHSAEMLLDASGQCLYFNMDRRIFDYTAPSPLEIGHINPWNHDKVLWDETQRMVSRCAIALGLHFGVVKADVLWTENGPKLLEICPRLSGMFANNVQRSTGQEPLKALLQLSCQLPLTAILTPHTTRYAASAAIIPHKEGIIRQLPSHFEPPRIGSSLCYEEILWNIQQGETVTFPQHCAQRAGFVVVSSNDASEAWDVAQESAARLAARMEII